MKSRNIISLILIAIMLSAVMLSAYSCTDNNSGVTTEQAATVKETEKATEAMRSNRIAAAGGVRGRYVAPCCRGGSVERYVPRAWRRCRYRLRDIHQPCFLDESRKP